ncbi:MAG TPA: transcriptional regulator [Gemmataceae bacterium]
MSDRKQTQTAIPGRYAYEGLDRVLHEKARLGIMTSLATRPQGLSFNELKQACALTDGNLNRHLDVLHKAGLVTVEKGYEGRRPLTTCRLTAEGRKRFLEYLGLLEQVIRDAQAGSQAVRGDLSAGYAPA